MPARRCAVECLNHLRQFGVALHNYHDTHQILPPGAPWWVRRPMSHFPAGDGGAFLLPMTDQAPLHCELDFRLGTAVDGNEPLLGQTMPLWLCPSDSSGNTVPIAVTGYPASRIAVGNYCGSADLIGPLSAVRFRDVTMVCLRR